MPALPVSSSTRGWWAAALLLLATLAAIGYGMLFSHFAGYDDEGYILLSARDYFLHGGLYERVYSQYGPAYYVILDVLQRILGPFDHTLARLLTLSLWLATAALCADLVRRETGSWTLTLFTGAATFLYLHHLTDEPFHPGGPCILILAASCSAVMRLISAGRTSAAIVVASVAGALLLLHKINVGLFFLASAAAWIALNASSPRLRRVAPCLVFVGLVAFGAALMRTLWHEPWIHVYLAIYAASAGSILVVHRGHPLFGASHAGLGMLAATLTIGVVLGLVAARGTSFSGLLDGILLRPLRHPGSYSYGADWRPGTLLVAGASLLIAFGVAWRRRRGNDPASDTAIVALRFGHALAWLVAFILLKEARVIGAVFSFALATLWFSLPLPAENKAAAATQAGRGFLVMVLLLQFLHAYPVAGSQESWATFLFPALLALSLGDLRSRFQHRGRKAAGAAVLAIVTGKVAWAGVATHRQLATRVELELPGAQRIRVSEEEKTAYHVLTLNAAVHADMLFSFPGLCSFHLWTGLPAPSEKNTTLWFTLLTDEEQHGIIRALEQAERPCVIVNEPLIALLQASRVPFRGPLLDHILQRYAVAFRTGDFAFLVRTGRSIAPLHVVRASATAGKFEVCLTADRQTLASIEGRDLTASSRPLPDRRTAGMTVVATPINRLGQATGDPIAGTLPLELSGLVRLSFEFHAGDPAIDLSQTALYLRDRDGHVIATGRFAR